jgi:hypothetical protein
MINYNSCDDWVSILLLQMPSGIWCIVIMWALLLLLSMMIIIISIVSITIWSTITIILQKKRRRSENQIKIYSCQLDTLTNANEYIVIEMNSVF